MSREGLRGKGTRALLGEQVLVVGVRQRKGVRAVGAGKTSFSSLTSELALG